MSLAATIAEPKSPGHHPVAFLSAPPPSEAPTLSRIKTAPAAPAAPSRNAAPTATGSQSPFEYHLHRLLFMVVAKCNQDGDEANNTSEPQVVLLNGIRERWTKVFGNDMSGLMEKCGYTEVEALVKAIDGLRIVGEGDAARVVTTRDSFEGRAAEAKAPVAETSTSQRRRPPPPPPVAPAPVLTPVGSKVLSLDNFVQSPSGKVPADRLAASAWGGGTRSQRIRGRLHTEAWSTHRHLRQMLACRLPTKQCLDPPRHQHCKCD